MTKNEQIYTLNFGSEKSLWFLITLMWTNPVVNSRTWFWNLKNEIQPQKSSLEIHKSKDSKFYFISASLIHVTLPCFQQIPIVHVPTVQPPYGLWTVYGRSINGPRMVRSETALWILRIILKNEKSSRPENLQCITMYVNAFWISWFLTVMHPIYAFLP